MKKIIKIVLIITIILILVLTGNVMKALAVSNSDLNEINGKIDETKERIDQVEQKLSSALVQIRKLNAEISDYENDISDLNGQIDGLDSQIAEAEANLAKAEEEYNHQQELLKIRIVAMYEAGETTYLDVLLSSKSITEFISKYYIVSEIAESDKNLLEQMEKNKIGIEEAKKDLETSKEQIEALKSSKEETANALKASQAVKQSYVDDLSDEEKELEEDLEQYEKDKKEIQAELERIARQNTANNGGTTVVAGDPNSAGYIFPIPGLSISNINRPYYPSYPGHTGADININVYGKNVVAVKSGTVVISTAQRNANGTYRSYGEYIVIDHHDGTMTLYAHGSPGSRLVSVGDVVSQGQKIMSVGTTGNSTGNHLHFEVRISGRAVNPTSYLP